MANQFTLTQMFTETTTNEEKQPKGSSSTTTTTNSLSSSATKVITPAKATLAVEDRVCKHCGCNGKLCHRERHGKYCYLQSQKDVERKGSEMKTRFGRKSQYRFKYVYYLLTNNEDFINKGKGNFV